MPAPEQNAIGQSLSAFQNKLPLFQRDIINISWEFAAQPDQAGFLKQAKSLNDKLAETLVIFRRKLTEAVADDAALEQAIGHALLHYVVNTDGQIPEPGPDSPFDVVGAATRYAAFLNVAVNQEEDGSLFLEVDDKKVPFPETDASSDGSSAGPLRRIGQFINRLRYGRDDVIPSFVFGFDENAEAHTLQNALTLADFSHLAYFGPAYVEKQLKLWGYEPFRWVEDKKTDTQALVTGKGSHLVVCFRGTSSGKDALVDTRFLKTKAFGGRGKVHRGFNKALDSVWPQVQAAVDELGADKKIFVSGHSLGAALAQLAAHRFALSDHSIAGVYVYGSPRIGNPEFRDAYNELLEAKTFLHINNTDIVARIPPRILGFRHLGGTPRQFDEGHILTELPKPKAILGFEEEEKEFDELDEETRKAILREMREAQRSMEASTQFLEASPDFLEGANSKGLFDIRPVDDHSMDEYLFKFGGAIVEEDWKQIEAP